MYQPASYPKKICRSFHQRLTVCQWLCFAILNLNWMTRLQILAHCSIRCQRLMGSAKVSTFKMTLKKKLIFGSNGTQFSRLVSTLKMNSKTLSNSKEISWREKKKFHGIFGIRSNILSYHWIFVTKMANKNVSGVVKHILIP